MIIIGFIIFSRPNANGKTDKLSLADPNLCPSQIGINLAMRLVWADPAQTLRAEGFYLDERSGPVRILRLALNMQ